MNPTTFSSTDVQVGPDHLLVLTGIAAVVARALVMMSDESLPFAWIVAGVLIGHVQLWRHTLTLPAVGSFLLALMSFGMSPLISGLVINKMIAERYRDAGWKIRNMDGELGEYSSRFLAVEHLGFRESDLMASVVRTHLDLGQDDHDTLPAAFLPSRQHAASRLEAVFTQQEGATRSAGHSRKAKAADAVSV
ncbi:MAG: hypothetical protein AB3X44_04610 [Leptothrix sp. (in: b-proteobacteria)]